ncbi:MAG: cysteine dioxygenase family protein [Actinomycetota bacterium]|nr:cysteine dioxygenase family protein [Actinomycetota bacterium]
MTPTSVLPVLAPAVTDAELERLAQRYAANPNLQVLWPDTGAPSSARLAQAPGVEIWLVSWPAGELSTWHDHGGSRAAFAVAHGCVLEQSWRPGGLSGRLLDRGDAVSLGSGDVHRVQGVGPARALTVHAYTPRLAQLVEHDVWLPSAELVSAGGRAR